MPSEKRARQRAQRAQKQAAIEQQRKRSKTLRRGITIGALVAVIVLIVVLIQSGGNGKKNAASSSSTSSSTSSTTTTSTVPVAAVAPKCPPMGGSSTQELLFTHAPGDCIPKTSVWDAKFETSLGDFTVQMDAAKSYSGVNNIVFLALYRYFDGSFFHRVIPGFVVQGGDPSGTGYGGPHHYPGYQFTGNTPPASCKKANNCYAPGDMALANSSGPTTNDGQFFIVLPGGQNTLNTEPNYTLVGKVISGMNVVDKIGTDGSSSGTPKVKVTLNKVIATQVKA